MDKAVENIVEFYNADLLNSSFRPFFFETSSFFGETVI
jgi:hypothetical protein